MKSLDQIEARRPIDPTQPGFSTPYTISNPGSYYLTGNLAVTAGDAIVIAVDGVTLDLNGFTLPPLSRRRPEMVYSSMARGGIFKFSMVILRGT